MNQLFWEVLAKQKLPPRKPNANKGDFGHVLIIGGALSLSGSARLAGELCAQIQNYLF